MTSQSIRSASELLSANLHEVFGERDPGERLAAIERTYSEDVKFIDPAGEFVGWQALNDRAQELLDDTPDTVFEEEGPRYFDGDTAALAWRLGPPGGPVVARGVDILTVRDGRVSVVHTPGSTGPRNSVCVVECTDYR